MAIPVTLVLISAGLSEARNSNLSCPWHATGRLHILQTVHKLHQLSCGPSMHILARARAISVCSAAPASTSPAGMSHPEPTLVGSCSAKKFIPSLHFCIKCVRGLNLSSPPPVIYLVALLSTDREIYILSNRRVRFIDSSCLRTHHARKTPLCR